MNTETNFSTAKAEDSACDCSRRSEQSRFIRTIIVAPLKGFLFLGGCFFFYKHTVAAWNEKLYERPKKPPGTHLFLAVNGGDTIAYGGATMNGLIGHGSMMF